MIFSRRKWYEGTSKSHSIITGTELWQIIEKSSFRSKFYDQAIGKVDDKVAAKNVILSYNPDLETDFIELLKMTWTLAVWPDLAKYRHFARMANVFGKNFRVN